MKEFRLSEQLRQGSLHRLPEVHLLAEYQSKKSLCVIYAVLCIYPVLEVKALQELVLQPLVEDRLQEVRAEAGKGSVGRKLRVE